jgi:hypothetical protein
MARMLIQKKRKLQKKKFFHLRKDFLHLLERWPGSNKLGFRSVFSVTFIVFVIIFLLKKLKLENSTVKNTNGSLRYVDIHIQKYYGKVEAGENNNKKLLKICRKDAAATNKKNHD